MAEKIKGIREAPGGVRITIYTGGKGKAVYDKTHAWDYRTPADLKKAIAFRDSLESRARLGLPLFENQSSERRQFWQVAQRFLDKSPIQSTSRSDYRGKLNRHVLPHIGHLIFEEITRQQIVDMVGSWNLAVSSKSVILAVTHGVFKYGGANPNPCARVSVGKAKKRKVQRYMPDERDALLGALQGHAQAFFAIFFGTGMRPGEIVALEWPDYDGQRFHVAKQITRSQRKDHTKNMEDRTVYVPTWVRPYIQNLDTRLAGGRLFSRSDYSDFYPEWREAHDKARIGAHPIRYRRPYTCRHTRAAELLSMGVMPAEAAAELGHSVRMFLDTYSEWIAEYCQDRDLSRLEGCVAIGRSDLRETREKG